MVFTTDTPTAPSSTTEIGSSSSRGARIAGRFFRRADTGALLVTVAMLIFFSITGASAGFLSPTGFAGWLNTAAELGIVAVPIALLMIAGEFDLSIGSVVGASGILVAILSGQFGVPSWISALIAIAMGLAVGTFNGFIVNRTGMPSFIVTLAANFILLGLALGVSRLVASTTTVSITLDGLTGGVLGGSVGGFNVSIIWWIVLAGIATWLLTRTPFGSWIFATGGNVEAARRAGVPTARVKSTLFAVSGGAAALLGVITTAEVNSGNAVSGQGFVFQAPVAAVIGGVLLTGGYGSVIGACLGASIYGIVSIGLFYTGWDTDWTSAFIGTLLLLAVLGNNGIRKLALSGRGLRRVSTR